MDADIFAALTSGARFDRKKYSKDVQVFKSVPAAGRTTAKQLDNQSSEPNKKRRKKNSSEASTAADAADDADIAIFNPSDAPTPSTSAPSASTSLPFVSSRDPMEEAAVIRKKFRIKVTGDNPPAPLKTFDELYTRFQSSKRFLQNLTDSGFQEPTPIQRQVIPALMGGRELFAIAPTGSGKTLAFLIPLVLSVRALKKKEADSVDGLRAVVLSPTHELAAQQMRVLNLVLPGTGVKGMILSKATAAGTNFSRQDILIANPLRLAGLIKEGKADLTQVRFLVMDEADKLFEMGFMEQIDDVLGAATHAEVTRALFSATLPEKVEEAARTVLHGPLRVTVGERNAAADTVKQRLLFVGKEEGKLMALRQLLTEGIKPPILVFANSKERAHALHKELRFDNCRADCLAADQSEASRKAAVEAFRTGACWVLISTDLVARGMDFAAVNSVINYDFPRSTTDYVHRVGRTGRAGRTGEAITFFTLEDAGHLRSIANVMKASGCEVPDWMLQLKKSDRKVKVKPATTISTRPKPMHVVKKAVEQNWKQGQKRKAAKTGAVM